MQITFQGQESTFTKTAKGGYSTMVISFLDQKGDNKSWKILSFANPKVFDTFKKASAGEVFEVTTRKNDKDFTEWADAVKLDKAAASSATSSAPSTYKSTYETAEERAARQRLIVRQSSLTAAINTLSVGAKSITPDDIVALAERYTAWVFEAPGLVDELGDVPL